MGLSAPDVTSQLLRHERLVIGGAIVVLTALGWAYVAGGMSMDSMRPPLPVLIIMWWLMMVAMMLPSAGPAILLYARVRQTHSGNPTIAQPYMFMAGYFAVWLLFSIAAALVQLLVTGPAMALSNRMAEAAVLLAAGVYQLSPLKWACLSQCRTPARFINRHWRPGWDGAVRLGLLHGAYCAGCCWLLMALLVVGGVMNLLWVVGLAALVAVEKMVTSGEWLGRAAGVAFIVWGAWKALG
jgi:predicted metal-binding membrane protein